MTHSIAVDIKILNINLAMVQFNLVYGKPEVKQLKKNELTKFSPYTGLTPWVFTDFLKTLVYPETTAELKTSILELEQLKEILTNNAIVFEPAVPIQISTRNKNKASAGMLRFFHETGKISTGFFEERALEISQRLNISSSEVYKQIKAVRTYRSHN